MSTWTGESIDNLKGKTYVITGGTSGIGLATARVLLAHGAHVVIGADDVEKGKRVRAELKEEGHPGSLVFRPLDLGNQRSIFAFAKAIAHDHPTVDGLINNAGLAAVPKRLESADGHELIFAVNYLGHFVLTSQLFPLLLRSRDPRVVSVSSLDHREAHLDFKDLEHHRDYSPDKVYSQSKLAILMFALELHRRCRAQGIHLRSIPVHPGAVTTHIFDRGPELAREWWSPRPLFQRLLFKVLGQEPDRGALTLLFAATSLEARSGTYYGPDGINEVWGNPMEAKIAVQAENMLAARRLWQESEKLSHVAFEVERSRSIGLH